jgi:hypothetical protein
VRKDGGVIAATAAAPASRISRRPDEPADRTLGGAGPRLPCRIRLADGRVFSGRLPAVEHRAIQLGMLHSQSAGLVELTPGTRPLDGRLELGRRARREHFLPGGAAGDRRWMERALEHAQRIIDGRYARRRFDGGPREECLLGVTARTGRAGGREHVCESRWLWVDVDGSARLDGLYAFLAERPCHLLVSSAGGSGGVHCYFRLAQPLLAVVVDERTGQAVEPIERANLRLINWLGADRQCKDRSRLLRLAGSRNYKTGDHARILDADLALAPYRLGELVGDLPDPEPKQAGLAVHACRRDGDDPYRRIPASEYMTRLAGRKADRAGFVRCPAPGHADEHPSCSVRGPHRECWRCMSCGASGGIYDLASLVLGGPTGRGLRGEDFRRARALVLATFGELHPKGAMT